MIGSLTVIVVGLIVSFITGANNPSHMDPDLFSPVIHRYMKTEHDVVAEIKLMKKRVNTDVCRQGSQFGRFKKLQKPIFLFRIFYS